MKTQKLEATEDLQAALKDIRLIRELVDRTRESHPIRLILRPHLNLFIISGPIMAIYGIGSQLILDAAEVTIWGLPKNILLLIMGGMTALLFGVLHAVLLYPIFKKKGAHEYFRIIRKGYYVDYSRIVLPISSLAGAACLIAVLPGNPHQIVGLVTAAVGAIWIAMPLALPLPEISRGGVFFLITGIIAIFVWPEYPFFKLAAIWGLGLVGIGFFGLRSFKQNG